MQTANFLEVGIKMTEKECYEKALKNYKTSCERKGSIYEANGEFYKRIYRRKLN